MSRVPNMNAKLAYPAIHWTNKSPAAQNDECEHCGDNADAYGRMAYAVRY
jgi:hypothetical protein